MSVTVTEHIANLRAKLSQVRAFGERVARQNAITGVSLVKARAENGIFKDGVEGNTVDYSQNEVPTFWWESEALNSGGRQYIKENPLGTWQDFKEAEGIRADKVTLIHSGKMWNDYQFLYFERSGNTIYAVAGVATDRAEIFHFNIRRYGPFYKNTNAEILQLNEDARQELYNFLNT